MKNYTLFTAVVPFAKTNEQSVPIALTVPNNAIPLQTEYLPTGQVFHFLVPCDESGRPVGDIVTPNIYEVAWNKLYELFGEQLKQPGLDNMDAVLKGVRLELEGEKEAKEEAEQES